MNGYEMGSEFWEASPTRRNHAYLLSGRTALDYIIRDILLNHKVRSVLLPAYCCHTMIEPFIRNQIHVRFYDVFLDPVQGFSAELPKPEEDEIFYDMTYFGFSEFHGINRKKIRQNYRLIIEDRTHSFLTEKPEAESDYTYTSYRKWSGLYGIALAEKKNGDFKQRVQGTNEHYCALRKKAMQLKGDYINHANTDKETFLALYRDAEELLETDYIGYAASNESYRQLMEMNTALMKSSRRKNADYLINALRDVEQIKLIFRIRQSWDTPLFVPIIVEDHRNALRKYLTNHQVFCPVHWPLSDFHQNIGDRTRALYMGELSLLCDQRYNLHDMERIVGLIKDFYKEGSKTL